MSSESQSSSGDASQMAADRDKLIADLKVLIDDAKLLGSNAAETSQEYLQERAEQLKGELNDRIDRLKEGYGTVKAKGAESVDELEGLIKKHPWRAVGIAVLAGVVIDRLLRD